MNIAKIYGISPPRMFSYKSEAECVNPDLVVGVELETEGCGAHGGDGWTKLAKPFQIDVKTDGSLRGEAYEFISRPMASKHCLAALKDFFEAAKFNDNNYSDRCSIHVHVNCTNLTLEQIANLAMLYTVVEEMLFEFVGHNRDTNIYCIPWNQCRQHLDLINRVLSDSANVLRKWNKYTALNLIPLASLGTVEFRQMHGTADMAKITRWFNIIGAMFKEATTRELKDLITEIKSLNSTSQYEAFFLRVTGGQLPYSPIYREKLEEGVIFAKYSLLTMDKKRTKPSARIEEAAMIDIPDAIRPRAVPQPANRNAAAIRRMAEINEAMNNPLGINVQNAVQRPIGLAEGLGVANRAIEVDPDWLRNANIRVNPNPPQPPARYYRPLNVDIFDEPQEEQE